MQEACSMPKDRVVADSSPATDTTLPAAEPQAQLLKRERELEQAYRIARLGSWRWVVATDTVTWSHEVYRAFGCDPALPPPGYEQIQALHTPEGRAVLKASVEKALRHGEAYEHELELILPDGSSRWIVARGEVGERDADGRVTELTGTIQDITQRKRTELALQEREWELIEAQRIARLGTFRWDKKTGVVSWSEEVYHAFGIDPRLPVPRGEETARLMTAESWQRISQATYDALHHGEPYSMDLELVDRDGKGRRWVTVRGEGRKGPDGEVIDLRGTVQDVTDRKRIEEMLREREQALRKTEMRFQTLYQSDLIGIGFPDSEGAIHDGNDELLRIVGYSREELEAGLVRWDKMTPPEWREIDLAHIAEARERGSCTPYEKEYIRKDGTRIPVLCGFSRMAGENPESIGFVMDLTVRKQAEQALREREKSFRDLANTLPAFVWVSEPNGRMTYINHSFEVFAGQRIEDMEGKGSFHLVHPDDRERAEAEWRRSVATRSPFAMELQLLRHDGTVRTFLVHAVPVLKGQGEIERWVGTATDVHDQKVAEEAVRRTEKLAAAGRLAASMAHEINNPLSAVTNSLYLALMDTSLSEGTRQFLRQAEQELARVAAVTTQTLRFHQQSTAPAEIDLGEIMDSALDLFHARFHSRGISVRREYLCQQRLFCRGDEMRQVFANLLSNALDATPDGGFVRIRIRMANHTCIWVSVADTGHGISRDLQRRLFEPFVSTKGTTGTGLGLWVARGIVQRHKGKIWIRSRVKTGSASHAGTVFSVLLPLDGMRQSSLDGVAV
jgi:PAS domain S-box-containing protein